MPGSAPRKKRPPRPAASDYADKVSREAAKTDRRADLSGVPRPLGDPLCGIVLVAEPPSDAAGTSARITDALSRSLAAVDLEDAYVVWPAADLPETLLSLEPSALVAVGPGAARAIDAAGYPLAKTPFSDAPEGTWFAWTKGALGLRLPALTPALSDDEAKRRFWRAFRSLRDLVPEVTARR
jgi:hypothetical protein